MEYKCKECGCSSEVDIEAIKIIFGHSDMMFIHDSDCPCKADPDDGWLYDKCKCEKLNNLAQAIAKSIAEGKIIK